jgi:hypothetical protein
MFGQTNTDRQTDRQTRVYAKRQILRLFVVKAAREPLQRGEAPVVQISARIPLIRTRDAGGAHWDKSRCLLGMHNEG